MGWLLAGDASLFAVETVSLMVINHPRLHHSMVFTMPRANWSFDAKRCINILFQVSEVLVYASIVLSVLGRSPKPITRIPDSLIPSRNLPFPHLVCGCFFFWKHPYIVADCNLPPRPGWRPAADGTYYLLTPNEILNGEIREVFRLEDPPQTVSGLYGPGAYASLLLVMLSSMVTSLISTPHIHNQHRVGLNADILTTNLYGIVATVDLLRRAYLFGITERGASYRAARQVVWNAWVFSLSVIGPNRRETSNTRLRVQYIALWIFTISQVLANYPYYTVIAHSYHWRPTTVFTSLLPKVATAPIPLAIYYRWSANIPSRFFKLLAAVVLFICVAHGQILIEYYWLFLPISVEDVTSWRLRVLLPPARSALWELDQAAPLITTILILLWQWKVWRLGSIAVHSARSFKFRSRFNVEEPQFDLETITPAAYDVESSCISESTAKI